MQTMVLALLIWIRVGKSLSYTWIVHQRQQEVDMLLLNLDSAQTLMTQLLLILLAIFFQADLIVVRSDLARMNGGIVTLMAAIRNLSGYSLATHGTTLTETVMR